MNVSHTIDNREESRAFGHREWSIVETVNSVAAVLLILSPWMFRYSASATATWSAVVIGLLLGVATFTRAVKVGRWPGWAILALGLCAVLAPWILGFGDIRNAAGMHVAAGLMVLVMTLLDLWVHYLEEPASPS